MTKGTKTIVTMGMVTVIFMMMMSSVYLGHVPNRADLRRLETDLREEFHLVLSPSAPLQLDLQAPESEGRRMGINVVCTMRESLIPKTAAVSHHLDEIAERILAHKRWRGRVDLVTVAHTPPLALSRTRRAPDRP